MLACSMSRLLQSDTSADGAAHVRAIVPEPPKDRVTLRALARGAKQLLLALTPPKTGSEAWLKQHGMLVVGSHSYLPSACVRVFAGDSARVTIGKWCSIAGDVEIMPGGNHRTDTVTTYPIQRQLGLVSTPHTGQPLAQDDVVSKGDVLIGNDVWIGRGAKILGGVTIGDGAVIAAWSVVTRSVAPYTLAAGVPARAVRQRFPEEIVESLLRIRWWDWEDSVVLARVDDLTSDDLIAFTQKYDPAIAATQTY